MMDPETPELNFSSFEEFLNYQNPDLLGAKAIIRCNNFNEEAFPLDENFLKMKIGSLEICCDDFKARNLLILCRYLDDSCGKINITIKGNQIFFDNQNSFCLLANIDRKLFLNLETIDEPRKIARNSDYNRYFSSSDSKELSCNSKKIPFLRTSPNYLGR